MKLIFPEVEMIRRYYKPLIYLAARTCYSRQAPDEIWDDVLSGKVDEEKMMRVIRHVIESGHHSTIEHLNFTFAISGVSRALSHQLVRHRIGVAYDQQSQRYVRFKTPDYVKPDSVSSSRMSEFYDEAVRLLYLDYSDMVERGVPEEDARYILPNAATTNLVMTVNLRQLMHMAGLRLCVLAQWEIRRMFKLIRKEVMAADEFFGKLLVPKCVHMGYCDEKRNEDGHCKIRPHKNEVFRVWNLYKTGRLKEISDES